MMVCQECEKVNCFKKKTNFEVTDESRAFNLQNSRIDEDFRNKNS